MSHRSAALFGTATLDEHRYPPRRPAGCWTPPAKLFPILILILTCCSTSGTAGEAFMFSGAGLPPFVVALTVHVHADENSCSAKAKSPPLVTGHHQVIEWLFKDDTTTGFTLVIGTLVAASVITSPVWLPQYLLHDSIRNDGQFLRYPYEGGTRGYCLPWRRSSNEPDGRMGGLTGEEDENAGSGVLCFPWASAPSSKHTYLRPYSIQVDFDFSRDYRFNINTLRAHLRVDTSVRAGLDLSYASLRWGAAGRLSHELGFGDGHFVIRIAQNAVVQIHAGAGVMYLLDGKRSQMGVSGCYTLVAFPIQPLVLDLGISAGTLGPDFAMHLHGQVGLIWNRFEMFAGLDYLRTPEFSTFGPTVGLRLWF